MGPSWGPPGGPPCGRDSVGGPAALRERKIIGAKEEGNRKNRLFQHEETKQVKGEKEMYA